MRVSYWSVTLFLFVSIISAKGTLPGPDQPVQAAVYDSSGNLYIGGSFDYIGNLPVNGLAKWDGNSWSTVETGFDSPILINALAIDSADNLYVGGYFDTIGGVSAQSVAKWDGSSWSALDWGVGGTVYALAVHPGGDLYAGGSFSYAGTSGALMNNVSKWNGSSWSNLRQLPDPGNDNTPGVGSTVNALAFDNSGELFVGGNFSTAGDIAALKVAKWTGTDWEALGSGMDNTVHALANDGSGNIYAGGYFAYAGGTNASKVAKWDGSQWHRVGAGYFDGGVLSLAADSSGNIYAGGAFLYNGTERLVKWTGAEYWEEVGAGVSGGNGSWSSASVLALALDSSGNLAVGGDFETAGGTNAHNLAIWNGSAWAVYIDPGEIAVAGPSGSLLAGGNESFGNQAVGIPKVLNFTISNDSSNDLTGLDISKDGLDAAAFAVGPLEVASLGAYGSTTFRVTYTPPSVGSHTAVMHIASNDPDENPFDITLTGTGLANSDTDMGSDAWETANGFDPNVDGDVATLDSDGDGVTDIIEIFQGTDRYGSAPAALAFAPLAMSSASIGDGLPLFDPIWVDSNGVLRVQYRHSTTQTAVNAQSVWSPDLTASNWLYSGESYSGAVVTVTENVVSNGAGFEIIEAASEVTSGDTDALFYTLELTPNE
jgi:hypothetical protein